MKFTTARIHRQEASDLSSRIAISLQKSADLLRELVNTGVKVPTDASALLRATDGSDQMWRTVRDRVTGNLPGQTLLRLRYGWTVAPSPADLLETMAKAAEHFDPPARGAVGKAISTRQGSAKTDYLKTFAGLLEVNHVARVADLARDSILAIPMAIVATVILNNPNKVIALRDFKQALTPMIKRRRERPEAKLSNSTKNNPAS